MSTAKFEKKEKKNNSVYGVGVCCNRDEGVKLRASTFDFSAREIF